MARKPGHNKVVYEEKIKNAINISLRRDIADPRLTMVSATRVELTPDYSQAKIYWDSFDASKRGEMKKAMEKSAGTFRSLLAKELNIRHTPELFFFYDSQVEDEKNIESLLSQDNSENEQ